MATQSSKHAVDSLASLRHGLGGIQLWGSTIVELAERIERNLGLCGEPRPEEYERALADEPGNPDLPVNDWSIILREARDALRYWWEAWYLANDGLDAARQLVNKPDSHPVESWSFGMRGRLNELVGWLEPMRPFPFGQSESGRPGRRILCLRRFVEAVQGDLLPDGWLEELAELNDADCHLRDLQNDFGIRPGRTPQALPAAGLTEAGNQASPADGLPQGDGDAAGLNGAGNQAAPADAAALEETADGLPQGDGDAAGLNGAGNQGAPADAAALEETADGLPQGDGDAAPRTTPQAGKSIGYKEVAKRLERLRLQGEEFQTQRYYAALWDVRSVSTINKAIKNTPSLANWAKPESVSKPKAQSLTEPITDSIPEQRESDPAEILEDGDIDAALQYLIEQASADERAEIHAMPPDKQRALARLVWDDPDRGARILNREA